MDKVEFMFGDEGLRYHVMTMSESKEKLSRCKNTIEAFEGQN